MSNPVSWFINAIFNHTAGGDKRPVFFEIDGLCPQLNNLTESIDLIIKEYESISLINLTPYHELDHHQKGLSTANNGQDHWSLFLLYAMGLVPTKAKAHCSETLKLLKHIPNLFQAFFSFLPAGKSIPKHQGSYKGYLRYHLALDVPFQNPPVLRINGLDYVWKKGKAILFDDTWPHEVINSASKGRAILVVDILRPMPAYASWLNKLLTKLVIRPFYGKKMIERAGN